MIQICLLCYSLSYRPPIAPLFDIIPLLGSKCDHAFCKMFVSFSIMFSGSLRGGPSSFSVSVRFCTSVLLASLSHNVGRYELLEDLRRMLSKNKLFLDLFKVFMEEEAKIRETADVYLITTETFQKAVINLINFCHASSHR